MVHPECKPFGGEAKLMLAGHMHVDTRRTGNGTRANRAHKREHTTPCTSVSRTSTENSSGDAPQTGKLNRCFENVLCHLQRYARSQTAKALALIYMRSGPSLESGI